MGARQKRYGRLKQRRRETLSVIRRTGGGGRGGAGYSTIHDSVKGIVAIATQPPTVDQSNPALATIDVRYYVYFNPPLANIDKRDEIIRHKEIPAGYTALNSPSGRLNVFLVESPTDDEQRVHCTDLNSQLGN